MQVQALTQDQIEVIKTYDTATLLQTVSSDSILADYLATCYRTAFHQSISTPDILHRMKKHYPQDFMVTDVITDTEMCCKKEETLVELQVQEAVFDQKAKEAYRQADLDPENYKHTGLYGYNYMQFMEYQRRLQEDGHFFACYDELLSHTADWIDQLRGMAKTLGVTSDFLLGKCSLLPRASFVTLRESIILQYDPVSNRFMVTGPNYDSPSFFFTPAFEPDIPLEQIVEEIKEMEQDRETNEFEREA